MSEAENTVEPQAPAVVETPETTTESDKVDPAAASEPVAVVGVDPAIAVEGTEGAANEAAAPVVTPEGDKIGPAETEEQAAS